jgi:hypothetical protein
MADNGQKSIILKSFFIYILVISTHCCLMSKNLKIRIKESIIFACGSVWVQNMVYDIKEGTQTEGV